MTWAEKDCDWERMVSDIQSELDSNKSVIPQNRAESIQHYLDHGEFSAAFEFLYLEIIERDGAQSFLGREKATEMALFFDLNNPQECMIDADFWPKFQNAISAK